MKSAIEAGSLKKEPFMSKSKDKGVTKTNKPKLSVKEKKEKKKSKENIWLQVPGS